MTADEEPINYEAIEFSKGEQSQLKALVWEDTDFGGLALRGPCPACKHQNGINHFVPVVVVTPFSAYRFWRKEPSPPTPRKILVTCTCPTPHPGAPADSKAGCGRWMDVSAPGVIAPKDDE